MPHIIEIAILLLIAFLIGCVIGYFVRKRLFPASSTVSATEDSEGTTVHEAKLSSGATATSQVAKEQAPQSKTAKPSTPKAADPVPTASKAKTVKASATKTAKPKTAPVKSKPAATKSKNKLEKAKAPPAAATKKTKAKPKSPAAPKPADSPEGKPPTLKAPRAGGKDDLKRIGGIGPKIEGTLNNLGVYHFDQIAAWDRKSISWVDDYLSFKGRIDREAWVDQAKKLAAEN